MPSFFTLLCFLIQKIVGICGEAYEDILLIQLIVNFHFLVDKSHRPQMGFLPGEANSHCFWA